MAERQSQFLAKAEPLPENFGGGGGKLYRQPYSAWLDIAVRAACGTLLIAAALLKSQPSALNSSTGPVPAGWPMILFVLAESALGLALLVGLWPQMVRLAAALFFACRSIVSAYKGLRGAATCGCLGELAVSPWVSAILDASAALDLVLLCRRTVPGRPSTLRLAAFAGLMPLIAAPLALNAWNGPLYLESPEAELRPGQLVVLEPQRWVGRRFPLLAHIDVGSELAQGEWTVVLYHEGCPKCRKRIALERRTAGSKGKLALVEMPPYSSKRPPERVLYGRLSNVVDWFAVAPLVVRLREGTVWFAADGSGG